MEGGRGKREERSKNPLGGEGNESKPYRLKKQPATVFAGKDMDYNMVVVSDACVTSHDQRAHDLLMELIFPRMARVRTTDQVLHMIREAR